MNYRRINLWGGPGAGKSTMAAYLYREMKVIQYNVEYSQEVFKPWAYQKKKPKGYDDLLLFAQQLYAEEIYLRHGVDYVVTDCPPLMCCVYNKLRRVPYWNDLVKIAVGYEGKYKSLNIFVRRLEGYQDRERIHALEDAAKIDQMMLTDYLRPYNLEYQSFNATDQHAVLSYVLAKIGPAQRSGSRSR